jgi:hypothetical protein
MLKVTVSDIILGEKLPVQQAKLNYNPLRVKDLFGPDEKYQVPRYQRGYAWTDEEVGELLVDLTESYRDFDSEDYLLGQIIVCPGGAKSGSWELIDGQQRTTTLYILLLAGFNRLFGTDLVSVNFAAVQRFGLLANYLTVAEGDDALPRILVAANGDDHIRKYLAQQTPEEPKSPTQANIRIAYDAMNSFFDDEFEGDLAQIWKFIDYVLDHVILVRLELRDASHALRVFLKVNNRGLSLDDADLLKSLLFKTVTSSDDFDMLSKRWDKASEELFSARLKRLKSMEFLMKALIGIETGKSVPTGRVYEKWAEILKTEMQVKDFANQLPGAAKNLKLLSKRTNPVTGEVSEAIVGSHVFKMVQHFEVLLAGSNLSTNAFEALIRVVEDRAVLSALAGEKNQAFERIIHPWALEIKKLDVFASEDDVLAASAEARKDIDELLVTAKAKFSTYRYSTQSHQIKIRYLLARVAKEVQEIDGIMQHPLIQYLDTAKKPTDAPGFDIDHIFPQADGRADNWVGDGYDLIHSIGNLLLLHPSDNRALSDALPSDQAKRDKYATSGLWINKSLVNKNLLGKMSPQQIQAMDDIQALMPLSLDNWGKDAILKREELYWSILERQFKKSLGL